MNLRGTATPGQYLTGNINKMTYQLITAYGIAVKNGFNGTEEEWLDSLVANPDIIVDTVNAYMDEHPVAVDTTLSISGQAADAKTTGEGLANLNKSLTDGFNAANENFESLDKRISAIDSSMSESLSAVGDDITRLDEGLSHADGHAANKANPHNVTTEQIGAAKSSHNHSASDINSGTLASDRLPTVPIAKGGTGATTAANALTNLGAQKALGFTPIQQGGGSGQNSNKIYIGWSSDSQLKVQVDTTDLGSIFNSYSSIVLGSGQYGSSLPSAGKKGRLFFKKV